MHLQDILRAIDEFVSHHLYQRAANDNSAEQCCHWVEVRENAVWYNVVEYLLVDERNEHAEKANHQCGEQEGKGCRCWQHPYHELQ